MHADMSNGLSSNQQQSRLAKIRMVNLEYRYENTELMLAYKLECNLY